MSRPSDQLNTASSATRMIDALDVPFVFTQRRALTVDGFVTELRERKVAWPDHGQLEAFHRAALLVPIYSIRYDPRLIRSRAQKQGREPSREELRSILDYTNTEGYGLVQERDIGDLASPLEVGYEPWSRHRRTFAGRPYQTRRYIYSYYQLLAVPMMHELWPRLRGRLGGRWRLAVPESMLDYYSPRAGWFARMVYPLTLLEPVYLPEIAETVSMPSLMHDFDEFDRFRMEFDPVSVLDRIGWSAEEVLNAAEALLTQGRGMDPIANLHELTRLIHPSHWKKLQGTARTAMDYRIAGEIFMSFYEDLARVGAARPLEPLAGRYWHPRLERLTTDRSELDATLTRFGLSPHPAVVLVLEGDVEHLIVPRVLDQLYGARWRTRIRLFNAKGIDQDLKLLAAFVAAPALMESDRDAIPLARHPTRFVVLSDAESRNATDDRREQRRQMWVRRIHEELSPDIRGQIEPSELDRLVHVLVWDTKATSYEYAHFTDEELADGLLAIAPHGPPRDELARSIARSRAENRNLKALWREGWSAPRPTKLRLADQLWPILSRRLADALQTESRLDVPVLNIVREVMRIATNFPSHYTVVIRRKKSALRQVV